MNARLAATCHRRYSHGMRLFLYGTLLHAAMLAARSGDPALPRRCIPATLRGWRRVALARTPWPTLLRDPAGIVCGMAVDVPATALARLADYEGDTYRLVQVVVTIAKGKTAAHTWIAPGGTHRPWKE